MLSMLKIYQTRHPDINASAYSTFGVLAGVIFLGMCGVLNGSAAFYVGFTILHVLTCFALTAQIYYMGRWKLGKYTNWLQDTKSWEVVENKILCLYFSQIIFVAVFSKWCNQPFQLLYSVFKKCNVIQYI